MIGWLSGRVAQVEGDSLILDVSGVGYELALTAGATAQLSVGASVSFHVYEQIREDAHNLYGFAELADKQLFVQLLSVGGVGPKVALAVLGAAGRPRLEQAIVTANPDLLGGISGVGRKTAERIVVELKGKLSALEQIATSGGDATYQALLGLGYTPAQAAAAAAAVPASLSDPAARVKAALRELAK